MIFEMCIPLWPVFCCEKIVDFKFPLVAVCKQFRREAKSALQRHSWYIDDSYSLNVLEKRVFPSLPSFKIQCGTFHERLLYQEHPKYSPGYAMPPKETYGKDIQRKALGTVIPQFESALPYLRHAQLEISFCDVSAHIYDIALEVLLDVTLKNLESFKVMRTCGCPPPNSCACGQGIEAVRHSWGCGTRCKDCREIGPGEFCEKHKVEKDELHEIRDAGDREVEETVKKLLESRKSKNADVAPLPLLPTTSRITRASLRKEKLSLEEI